MREPFGHSAFAQDKPAGKEKLAEMYRRAARRGKATWPARALGNELVNSVWPPETLCYKDATTGAEVWRMTNTPNLRNYYHNDIAMSPWSANGRVLGLTAWRITRGREARALWMVVNADGSKMRATVNRNGYMHWSPLLPDVFYTPGGAQWFKGVTSKGNILYKVTITDEGPATNMKALVTYPEGTGCSSRKFISADGKMYVAMPSIWPGSKGQEYEMFFLPTRIFPDEEAKPLLAKGYTVDRDFGDYIPSPYKKGRYHDAYLLGDGTYYFAIDRTLGYWRIKTLGSAPDGGPQGIGKELIPADARKGGKIKGGWPALEDHKKATGEKFFLGHPGFGRWGEMVCYADYDTQDVNGKWSMGSCVYDFINHRPAAGKWIAQSNGVAHCDWEAFADWCVASVYKNKYIPGDDRIECFPYDKIGKNFVVCYTHNQTHGGKVGNYYNHTRPAQSPDGTKVAWHSSFLNGSSVSDPYWAVCYYPKPPKELKAEAAEDGGAKLTWKTPEYTKRGWPKKKDPPPPAREVKAFHIWRAKAAEGPWEEVGSVTVEYKVNVPRAIMEPQNLEFVDKVKNGTYYYALTSEEYSTLESNVLSEILKVDVKGKNVTGGKAADAGTKGFWKTPPAAPKNFSAKKGGAAGHYELSWTEPQDDRVRYYNIYYSTGEAPRVDQNNLIASLPLGTAKYLDWLADPDKDGRYAITSVDRYDNESKPVYP